MRVHYPKLRNMTHALSLSVIIAVKGTNVSILNGKRKSLLKLHLFVGERKA